MSKGRSGIRITSAPPASPACSAIQPAWRPITSTTITRLCDSAVVCSLSIASHATCSAVSKPKVMSVPPRSLSIVFGTPTSGSPCSECSRDAAPSVSSPPMTIRPSSSSSERLSAITTGPSSRLKGLVREVPRIVPPRGRMPRVDSTVSSSQAFSSGPRQPSRKPTIEWPCWSMPLRTTARITAFKPGQSPPPVSTPMRTAANIARVRERHPARGYALAAAGAAMFALNGSLARYLLPPDGDVSALRLSQLRSIGSWLILLVVLGAFRPALLRVDRRELPSLALLGVVGLAGVHATYFLAIDRLQIRGAVTIQYLPPLLCLAPLLLLLWLRVFHGRRLAPGLWGSVALSVVGCFFVVQAYDASSLD